MKTPARIKKDANNYKTNAWQKYTLAELGSWVHLLATRSQHRSTLDKASKDMLDAQAYLSMIQSMLDDIHTWNTKRLTKKR